MPSSELVNAVETFYITSEHTTVAYFHHHFSWSHTLLWPSDLATPSVIVLSDEDQFVPVKVVRDSFEANRASLDDRPAPQVLRFPVGHGHFLLDRDVGDAVLSAVRDMQDVGSASATEA